MIIRDELPFRQVEKDGFRAFHQELQPLWPGMNRRQVAKGVLDLYNEERVKLMSYLNAAGTRISITTDTWTSIQNINYMVVTAHFMDSDWQLHKRIINFCPIVSHKGEDLGRTLDGCLRKWEISKVFTITVDNAYANDTAIGYMKRRLRGYRTLLFDGEYLHLRCACHIINLIVKDGLKELQDGIETIWNCAKYVRSSAARLDKFREFAVQEKCNSKANVPLDVVTRWNSTYLMLQAALKFESVFGRMAEEDEAFRKYFEDKSGPPQFEDWRNAEAFCVFLKKFYDATNRLSAWKTVTANILFVELISLQSDILKACDSTDMVVKRVAKSMKEKFDKYWGSFELVNKLIIIATVLDPRYKLPWVIIAMKKIKASQHVINTIEDQVKRILIKMFQEYKDAEQATHTDSNSQVAESELAELDLNQIEGLDDVSKELLLSMASDQSQRLDNEVDQYLAHPNVSILSKGFDIANWWKGNQSTFPILSKIAKDIFAMPCSTVPSESAFNLGNRVVDPFRASLTPQMVEALVCTTDWLNSSPVNLQKEPSEDELAFYYELEAMEKENALIQSQGTGMEAATPMEECSSRPATSTTQQSQQQQSQME